MSTAAARGDDAIAFYAADLGETRALAATTSGDQTTDVDGALVPGRYLIQIVNVSDSAAIVWIHAGAFEKGKPITLAAGPGRRRAPLSTQSVVAIETNVLKGDSDRIGAITTVGTATVYVTRISRGA